MKEYARVVEVPAIEKDERAYDHDRPISSLIMHQLRQLHAAEQFLDDKDRTHINITELHTELQASKYIQKVMRKLHPLGTKKRVGKARQRKRFASSDKSRAVRAKRK